MSLQNIKIKIEQGNLNQAGGGNNNIDFNLFKPERLKRHQDKIKAN